MLIRDTFSTAIQKRIEPTVKVVDRRPLIVQDELNSLVVTPQWEKHVRAFLDTYAEAADREDEQAVGIWVSGFFGSGKSLLVKVIGTLLEGSELDGHSSHELFLNRLPATSSEKSSIGRYLTIIRRKLTTSVVGGNLHTMQAYGTDPLTLIAFRLFAEQRGFTKNWGVAWAVEYQIDERGKTGDFRQLVEEHALVDWIEVLEDPEIYLDSLYAAAAEILPDNFREGVNSVERAVNLVTQNGITPTQLIDRMRRWCANRDGGGRKHKLLLQLDELGQWIGSGDRTERAQQVQALIETAAARGEGRIWIAVTAHGDVQALQSSLAQEEYAKINQRFANKCKLTNDDISLVVEDRLLRKHQDAHSLLMRRFNDRSGDLTDMGTIHGNREYPVPNAERFALFYPYMPWTVAIIPDVVKGVAQAANLDEALSGSSRTMISVVQGGIIETAGLLEEPVGRILCLADLYDQLAADAPIETKTDINKISTSVLDANEWTPRVAKALYLLGEAKYIPPTLEQLARTLVDSTDAVLADIKTKALQELEKLIAAGFAKQVGDVYSFLSTQQRTFQDRVRDRQSQIERQTHELIAAFREYESEDALLFDKVPLHGRDMPLKFDLDGKTLRNPTVYVALRVASPFQRAFDTQLANDAAMKQRSNEKQDEIFVRFAEVPGLRSALALAMATELVAKEVIDGPLPQDAPEKVVARQARQTDLPAHKTAVRKFLVQSVRGARVFFRGTSYDPMPGDGPGAALRTTLAEILPQLYARAADVPHRIQNEETAVKAALAGNPSNVDIQALGVYRNDGTLNDGHPLLSTIRSRLTPVDDEYQNFVQADALRSELQRPPFGWDGNTAKVGLALLLRASACRLADAQRIMSDPNDPDVILALTKEAKFRALRVQGVKSDLSMDELREIRGYIEALFGVQRPALVQATLSNILGEELIKTARTAQDIQNWANTARCPLPTEFESGQSLVSELINTPVPQARLPRFREQAETLIAYHETLHNLEAFVRNHATEYGNVREFFTSMVNADTQLAEVNRFIRDWQTVTRERTVTTNQRWDEVARAYHTAQAAVAGQIAQWQRQTVDHLAELESRVAERVRALGIPEEHVQTEVSTLLANYADVRRRAEQSTLDFKDGRGMLTALTNAELQTQRALAELRARYAPEPESVAPPTGTTTALRLSNLISVRQIATADDIEELLDELRRRLQTELNNYSTISLE